MKDFQIEVELFNMVGQCHYVSFVTCAATDAATSAARCLKYLYDRSVRRGDGVVEDKMIRLVSIVESEMIPGMPSVPFCDDGGE